MNRTSTKSPFTYHHFIIFWLTFIAYSLFHASRKTFSNVKTTMSDEWTESCDLNNHTCEKLEPDSIWNSKHFFEDHSQAKFFLGILDAIFLAAYSLGLFISGILGDRFNLRFVLTIGMILSAISMFLFGVVSEWTSVYSKYWYVGFWIINGFAQSTGWPAVVAVMGNWFGKSGRGLIFGIWSACASVGNILGALMVSSVLKYGYHYSFIFTSSVLFAGAIVTFFGLIPSPKEIGLPDPDAEEGEIADADEESQDRDANNQVRVPEQHHEAIGFFKALLLPGVIMYSLCYACLKMVNYSFLFWLPFYLTNKFHWLESDADKLSIWYDVGGIFGGIIGGLISDLLRKRSVVIFALLILAIPSLYIFGASTDNRLENALLMTVVGFFIGGAANMISATITADLGKQGPIQGNTEALATVTGIVDGTGSVGAAIGQILVPLIQTNLDWKSVFYFFIILCVLTNVCILPLFIREVREMCTRTSASRATLYTTINTDSDSESQERRRSK